MTEGAEILHDMSTSGGHPYDLLPTQIDRLRDHFTNSFYDFASIVCGMTKLHPPLHRPICALFEQWGTPGSRRLMVQIPRGSYKTSLITISGPLWLLTQDPNRTIAIFNEKLDNSRMFVGAIEGIVRRSPFFHVLYSHLLPPGITAGDTRSTPKSWPFNSERLLFVRDNFREPEMSITAFGMGAASAGHHWSHTIMDDLISRAAADSPIEMQHAKDWFDTSIYLGITPELWNCFIACTRWHYSDIYEYAIKKHGFGLYRRSALENGKTICPPLWSTEHLLEQQERDPINFCTPAETPITMSDLSLRRIEDVKIGNWVLGFERAEKGSRATPTRVVDKGVLTAEVWEYGLSDGSFVRCTENHQWFGGDWNHGFYPPYRALGDLSEGRLRLNRIHSIPPAFSFEQQLIGAQLAGLWDGEGSAVLERITIAQSQKANPEVCQWIESASEQLGMKAVPVRRGDGYIHSYTFRLPELRCSASDTAVHFLAACPSVVGRHKIYSYVYGKKRLGRYTKPVSRKSLGIQQVYWLETATGNYVAWGCISKNSSQMQNIPVAGKNVSFQPSWLRFGTIAPRDGEDSFIIDKESYSRTASQLYASDFDLDPEDFDDPPPTIPLHTMTKTLLVDPSPTTDTDRRAEPNARTALVMVGKDPWGRQFILDLWAGNEEPIPLCRRILGMLKQWGTTRLGIEEVVFSKVYAPMVRYVAEREFRNMPISYLPLKPGRRDKDTRIAGLAPLYQAGMVYLNHGTRALHAEEYLTYPYGSTRDILDAESYSLDPGVLPRPTSGFESSWSEQEQWEEEDTRDAITGY